MLSVVGLVLPVQILSALITASVAPEQFDLHDDRDRRRARARRREFLVGQAAIVLLSFVSVLLATAVCFKAVADAYLGARAGLAALAALRACGGSAALVGVAILGGLARRARPRSR